MVSHQYLECLVSSSRCTVGSIVRSVEWVPMSIMPMKTNRDCHMSFGTDSSLYPLCDVGTGMSPFIFFHNSESEAPGARVRVSLINSPGTIRIEPYTSSADKYPISSFGARWIPNKIQGSSSAPVRNNLLWNPKPGYPAIQESSGACVCGDTGNWEFASSE